MMKRIVGKVTRKEGQRERTFTKIQCDCCGRVSYERKLGHIQKALERGCKACKAESTRKVLEDRREAYRLVREQDKALIAAHRSILKLLPRTDKRITHGLCRGDTSRTYRIWMHMMARCYRENNQNFEHYGGRGIKVCERWHDVSNFIEDMGVAPDNYSIERHDVNGDYEPFNCSWIPSEDQSKNRRLCYINRGIFDPEDFRKRKQRVICSESSSINDIPFGNKNGLGWWRQFGLYNNPYIYGPMPWKRTSLHHRRAEAIKRGWYIPKKK